MNDQESIALWGKVTDPSEALRVLDENEMFLGTGPYYRHLHDALMKMVRRCIGSKTVSRVRIAWPSGRTIEGPHLATIPANTVASAEQIMQFYGIERDEIGWNTCRIRNYDRYLIELRKGFTMVAGIEPGVTVEKDIQ